jgi:hypothetical protein
MTQPLFAFPTQQEITQRLLVPLRRAGVSRLYWRTKRESGEAQAYITTFQLHDAAGNLLPSTLLPSGFLVLYAISDAQDPDGGCFELDMVTGVYRRIARLPEVVAATRPIHAEEADTAAREGLAG